MKAVLFRDRMTVMMLWGSFDRTPKNAVDLMSLIIILNDIFYDTILYPVTMPISLSSPVGV
jgi:hypothetical protein